MRRTGTAWRRTVSVALAVFILILAARADDTPPTDNPPVPPASPAPASTASAPAEIGRSVLVVNEVEGQYGDAPAQHLKINDNIVFSEDITTGADAKAVLEFRDGSTFEIGADAVVRIDSFVFNPEEGTSQKAMQVTRGVFRYVSGYVASDQDTKITTPAGEMGIRGSVVEGAVDPGIPDFVYVGEGNATFTNGAGRSDLVAGGSIAVPSATTAPMSAAQMPAAVSAQAVQVIERHLPPPAAVEDRPVTDAWLQQTGAANLVPVANQRQAQSAAPARPIPTPPARSSLAGELGLLVDGNRVNLFRGGQAPRTPDQTAFIARAARDNPGAAAAMQRYQLQAQTMHRASMTAGTAFVIRGVGHAAPSAEVMRRVTAASVRANPAAEAAITRHATESYRGPDRGELLHPGSSAPIHPQERNLTPHTAPENREFHTNPQQTQPRPFEQNQRLQQQNLNPQQLHQNPAGRQPLPPNNFGSKLPPQQQRGYVPGQPQPPRGYVPGQPQPPRGYVPGQPQPPRGYVPGQQQQLQQRNFGPRQPPPKQPPKKAPEKKEDQNQR